MTEAHICGSRPHKNEPRGDVLSEIEVERAREKSKGPRMEP